MPEWMSYWTWWLAIVIAVVGFAAWAILAWKWLRR